MSEQITVKKKKKLTIKKDDADGPEVEDVAAELFVEPTVENIVPSSASYTWAVILACLAVVLLLGLVLVEYLEWTSYHAPDTAFPLRVAPTTTPAPVE